MTRISRARLSDEIWIRIYQLFFEVIAQIKTKKTFNEAMEDIFSPTERIMVAKRIAIIYLLLKNVPQLLIAKTLKVSSATVSRYAVLIENRQEGLRKIISLMMKKEKVLDFLNDVFADLFIQPGIKIGHWDLYWQHKKRKERKKSSGL